MHNIYVMYVMYVAHVVFVVYVTYVAHKCNVCDFCRGLLRPFGLATSIENNVPHERQGLHASTDT